MTKINLVKTFTVFECMLKYNRIKCPEEINLSPKLWYKGGCISSCFFLSVRAKCIAVVNDDVPFASSFRTNHNLSWCGVFNPLMRPFEIH